MTINLLPYLWFFEIPITESSRKKTSQIFLSWSHVCKHVLRWYGPICNNWLGIETMNMLQVNWRKTKTEEKAIRPFHWNGRLEMKKIFTPRTCVTIAKKRKWDRRGWSGFKDPRSTEWRTICWVRTVWGLKPEKFDELNADWESSGPSDWSNLTGYNDWMTPITSLMCVVCNIC